MKQILISKNIAYAAKVGGGTIAGINEMNLLDTGSIAVFTDRNELLTAANAAATLLDRKKFYVAVGNVANSSQSKTYISVPIPRLGTNYIKTAYVAPVKLVKYIGNDGTTAGTQLNYPTLVVGDEAQIKITDTTLAFRSFATDFKRYNTVVKTGDTAALITARLVTAINADPDSIVVAAGVASNTGISLTTKDFSTTFDIALDGIIVNATIEEPEGSNPGVSVAINLGEGSSDQMAALELAYSPERGNTNQLWQPQFWYQNQSLVINGVTYNVYTLTWNGARDTALGRQETYMQEVKVVIPSSGTAPTTAFEAVMAEAFGGAFSTSKVEPGT